jgi:hypothetical protein
MKHLRNLLKETGDGGAVTAGDVAGVRGSLFPAVIKRQKVKTPKIPVVKFKHDTRTMFRESALSKLLRETADKKVDTTDVISKLKSAHKNFEFEKDSVAFGINDENGNVVKVFVRANQAEQFERALAELMHDDTAEQMEVPEMLFSLKDKFEILHIDWGKIEEDEEPEVSPTDIPPDGETPEDGAELSLGDDSMEDESMGDDSMGDEQSGVESALDKVIAMLKADAEARTAEAKAKEAEANAKEAEFAAKAADVKVKGEEEVLDMETHFKAQTDAKKESQKLAKLARYRHEKALSLSSDESDSTEGGSL